MSAHARKFAAAYLALAALFGAAIGLFVVFAQRPAHGPPIAWSSWKPSGVTAVQRSAQIASHVAARYRLPSGHQLVRVSVGGPGAPADPIRAVAIARTLNPQQSDILAEGPVDETNTTLYQLCGKATNCAINEGKPTAARADVLRREALELALYTFRYVPGVSSVVTFFPPRVGQNPTYAFLFTRDTYMTQLQQPLARTLSRQLAPKADTLAPAEQTIVHALTKNIFVFGLQRTSDGRRVLVLAPPPPFH